MSFGYVLFSFTGRINRAKYWAGVLFWTAICIVMFGVLIYQLADIIKMPQDEILAYLLSKGIALFVIFAVIFLVMIVSGLALGVKRMHDRDKTGWWVVLFYYGPAVLNGISSSIDSTFINLLLSVASLVIAIWGLVELGFLRGTAGPNRFGPDPLSGMP
jgi:uncharacterized membrane protein YhaH (DUF805 family)